MADIQTCIDLIIAKSGGKLNKDQARDAMNEAVAIEESLIAKGLVDNLDSRVAAEIAKRGVAAKYAAAGKRKQAAINAIVRDRLNVEQRALEAEGLDPDMALHALSLGTQQGVAKGRNSAMKLGFAWESRIGEGNVLAVIVKERPHIEGLIGDQAFDDAVTRELGELKKGGTPGITKNADAEWYAKQLAYVQQEGRTGGNSLGANIGFIPGYLGRQVHDDLTVLKAGVTKWIEDVKGVLDVEESFPEVTSEEELNGILHEIWQSIVSGLHRGLSPAQTGVFTGGRNIARSISSSRTLHFKNADAAIKYRDLYGRGSTSGTIFAQQKRLARLFGAMQQFGPNPEVMIKSRVAKRAKELKATLGTGGDDKAIQKMIDRMKPENFQKDIDLITGQVDVPLNTGKVAKILSGYRGLRMFSSLGAAVLPSMSGDTLTAATAAMLRGQGYWRGFFKQISGLFEHVGNAEARRIAYIYNQALDGWSGTLTHHAAANDLLPGWASNRMAGFFKWNGLTGWTDLSRGSATQAVVAHLGMEADKSFDKLDWRFQQNLRVNGLDGAKWDVLRQGTPEVINGNRYIVPDSVRNLTDDQIMPLVPSNTKPKAMAKALHDAREGLEMDLRGYVADEVNYGILTVDTAVKRYTTGGLQRASMPGEVVRSLMLFRGFTAAYTQRVMGRTLYGGPQGQRLGGSLAAVTAVLPNIASMIASMTVAGYIGLTIKDMAQGISPRVPRTKAEALALVGQSLVAGGGLGVYGDFLFGQAYSYQVSGLAAALGPIGGTVEALLTLWGKARGSAEAAIGLPVPTQDQLRAMDALNLALSHTPYANLFYVRPALDWLVVNALREHFSPGYLHRQETNRLKYTGQTYNFPRSSGLVEELAR